MFEPNQKLAVFSPSKNSYSETFIQAHRRLNGGNVAFYYGAVNEIHLDETGPIQKLYSKVLWRLVGYVFKHTDDYDIYIALKRSFRKNRVSKVLIEYGTYGSDLLPYLMRLNIPFIVHFHGYDATSYDVLEKRMDSYKRVFELASYVIAVSLAMEKQLLSLGCPPEKLIYNVYGPHEMFGEIVNECNEELFVSVGRLVNKKAPYYLILSFVEVLKAFPNAKLVIIGTGPLMEVCKNMIAYFGLGQSIILLGRQTPNEIKDYFSRALAYVQHSVLDDRGDSEGTPLTILEASASGLPVVSTYHAGIPDVIVDQKTGFLVNEHDVKGMAERMIRLLEDKTLAIKMGNEGKEYIKLNFTLQRHLDKLDELFSKV